jgi:DNA-binding transcriptional ArsR family regulator
MRLEITRVRIILVVMIAVLFTAAAADLYHQTVTSPTAIKGVPDVVKNITANGTYLDTTDFSGYKTSGLPFRSALLAMVAFFLLGVLIMSLVYEHRPFMHETPSDALAETADTNPDVPEQNRENNIESILNILKGNEQCVIKELFDGGEMNQAELAARIGISKSTLSRTLYDLESRKLIIRYRNGVSKMVKLADSFKR